MQTTRDDTVIREARGVTLADEPRVAPRTDQRPGAQPPRLRVLVVDDSRAFADSVATCLASLPEVLLVGQAHDDADASRLLEERRPDVVLLDLHIPGVNTAALARHLRAGDPAPVVVLMTGHGPEVLRSALAECALEHGLTKDDLADRLGPLLREVARRRADERTHAQQQLQRLHHLRTTALLASSLVHDLNNPLTCLHIEADICRKALEQATARLAVVPSEVATAVSETLTGCQKNLDGISASLKQISGLTREFASLTRGTDPRQRLPLRQVAEQAIRVTLARTRLRAQTELRDRPGVEVLGQPLALTSVLINLIINAAEAFREHHPDNRIDVVLGVDDDSGVPEGFVDVIDNGPGIPQAIAAALFEPLATSKTPGERAGLGLYTSHAVMRDMGGRLTLLRTGRDGTAFRVALPRPRG